MGSFSTERFGLRGCMVSTFSKRVRKIGTPILSKIDENWSEMEVMARFGGFVSAKSISQGSGTSWDYSRPLKRL